MRKCSRTACSQQAVATLTYVYSDSTAVVGPLATYAEPHTYDLCTRHAEGLTPPLGWEIVRLTIDGDSPAPSATMALCLGDDLSAIVDAVREEPARSAPRARGEQIHPPQRNPGQGNPTQLDPRPRAWESGATRGHLRAVRVVADPPSTPEPSDA